MATHAEVAFPLVARPPVPLRADWTSRLITGAMTGAAEDPPFWLRESYRVFRSHVMDPAYPCYFGTTAEREGDLYYSFVSGRSLEHLPATITTFIGISRVHRGDRNNLAVFFEPEPRVRDHDYYRREFWRVLRYLQDHDPARHLNTGPSDPHDYMWEFSFSGTQFFVVAASPAYTRRRSRNLGPGLIMLFQPRDVFETATGDPLSQEARNVVRRRAKAWDGLDVHPDMGVYPSVNNHEWKQYYLPDDLSPESGVCPLAFPRMSGDELRTG